MHYLYKTTVPDGRFYVGCSKFGLDTDYLGSGKMLREYIREYGKEGITREIMREFVDREDACQYEQLYQNYYLKYEPELCLFTKQSKSDFGADETSARYGKPAPNKGKKHSDEARARIRKARLDPNVTPQIVRGIRLLRNQKKPWSREKLAKAYGLTEKVVRNVVNGLTWGDID